MRAHSQANRSDGRSRGGTQRGPAIPAQSRGAVVIARRQEAGQAAEALPEARVRKLPSALHPVGGALLAADLLVFLVLALVAPWSHAGSVALATGLIAAFAVKSHYKSRLTLSVLDDLPVIVTTVPAVVALVALASPVTSASVPVLLHGSLTLGLLVLGRSAAYAGIRWARRRDWVAHRALIVGSGPTASLVTRLLDEHREHGLRVVGLVGRREDARPEVRGRVVEEDTRQLVRAAQENRASVVVLTLSGSANEEILEALRGRDATQFPFTLFAVPALQEMLHSPGADRVGHVALVRLREPLLHVLPLRLKRAFDIAVSVLAVAFIAPVLALVALAVRFEMGRGVLFKQVRVGKGGLPFTLYKFRSMRLPGEAESDVRWCAQKEVLIGPVGRFIRKTSLDELPQLFNIIRGDMSLVGPRPERPHFVEEFKQTYDWYPYRHRVCPGLTGWAAVNGLRGDTSIEDRCLYDNAYIDNWSFWLDMKILARTVTAVLRGEGS